jgi:hypothetical protein
MPPIADAIEAWHPIVVAAHRLAVDDAGERRHLLEHEAPGRSLDLRQVSEPDIYAGLQ